MAKPVVDVTEQNKVRRSGSPMYKEASYSINSNGHSTGYRETNYIPIQMQGGSIAKVALKEWNNGYGTVVSVVLMPEGKSKGLTIYLLDIQPDGKIFRIDMGDELQRLFGIHKEPNSMYPKIYDWRDE